MKPKISPQEYRLILEALELTNISLIESTFKLKDEKISKTLNVDIDEKFSFEQKGNILLINYLYKLQAQSPEVTEPAIVLSARYSVKYTISRDVTITKEFMKVFVDLTVSMLLWTFFREYVNNSVYRMGMPSLILGLKKK
jgi:hypothetical protein